VARSSAGASGPCERSRTGGCPRVRGRASGPPRALAQNAATPHRSVVHDRRTCSAQPQSGSAGSSSGRTPAVGGCGSMGGGVRAVALPKLPIVVDGEAAQGGARSRCWKRTATTPPGPVYLSSAELFTSYKLTAAARELGRQAGDRTWRRQVPGRAGHRGERTTSGSNPAARRMRSSVSTRGTLVAVSYDASVVCEVSARAASSRWDSPAWRRARRRSDALSTSRCYPIR
jgi:hypothetical protein